MMRTLKAFRNALGTPGLLFAGYIFLVSLKDSWRYIKISRMCSRREKHTAKSHVSCMLGRGPMRFGSMRKHLISAIPHCRAAHTDRKREHALSPHES